MQRAVRRFMPGETLESALDAAAPLEAAGIGTMYTRLGENLTSLDEADEVADHYIAVFDAIARPRLPRRGLGQADPARARPRRGPDARPPDAPGGEGRRDRLVPVDRHGGQRLRRGDHPAVRAPPRGPAADRHLPAGLPQADAGRRRAASAARPGDPAGQGRLRRVRRRSPIATSARSMPAISSLAVDILKTGRGRPIRLGLGTHDVALVEQIAEQVDPAGVPRDGFEVEMLYGIRAREQYRLAKAGYRVQTLIAYGEHWYPWYMRRLAERPANVAFAIRSLLAVTRRSTDVRLVDPARRGPDEHHRDRERVRGQRPRAGARGPGPADDPPPDRRARFRHARPRPRGGQARARRGRDPLRAVPRHPRAAPGDRRRRHAAQGLRGRSVAGVRHRRRQGRDAVRDPRPDRPGRRGHRARPWLPDLRVADAVRRRHARADPDPDGARVPARRRGAGRAHHAADPAADHQLAGQPDRRRADARRPDAHRRARAGARPVGHDRRDLRPDPVRRGGARLDRVAPRDGRNGRSCSMASRRRSR